MVRLISSVPNSQVNVYNTETAILVATRSRAKVISLESSYVPLGLDEVSDLSAHFHDVHLAETTDWESWAHESNIELCDVRLGFDGFRTGKFAVIHPSQSKSSVPLVLATSPLPPLRFGAHPLSSLMFCPGDPHHLTVAESSPGPLTAKLYLCLSFIDCGKCDESAFGMENRLYPRADSTIPKSELVVFGLYKRANPHISEWVRFSSWWHLYEKLTLRCSHLQS